MLIDNDEFQNIMLENFPLFSLFKVGFWIRKNILFLKICNNLSEYRKIPFRWINLTPFLNILNLFSITNFLLRFYPHFSNNERMEQIKKFSIDMVLSPFSGICKKIASRIYFRLANMYKKYSLWLFFPDILQVLLSCFLIW